MNKVCMIEYQGRCDADGKAVGHAPKVLRECMEFIRQDCEISVLAPKVILRELPRHDRWISKVLPHHIVMKGQTPFLEKITNKLHMFTNIKKAIKHANADILWFFNVEYYLMLYLFLHKKPKQRLVCTMFLDGYHAAKEDGMKARIAARVKQWVFERAQKKIDLIIATGKQFAYKNCPYEYIPDYYDRRQLYKKYRDRVRNNGEKKDIAVCLGTMGNGKQLEEMTEAFLKAGYPLKIAGRFYDEERVERLKESARKSNGTIEIVDKYLTKEEYLTLMAEAKYTVLPYSPINYASQTSGVMQEAVFLDTVPITYQAILSGNGIPGVGFNSWEQLPEDLMTRDRSDYLMEYRKLRGTEYREDIVKESYLRIFAEE